MSEKKPPIHPVILQGNWKKGWALDYYSNPDEAEEEIQRSALGELLYRCKYSGEIEPLKLLAEAAAGFLGRKFLIFTLHCILPAPPSDLRREFQPVEEIAKLISRKLNLPLAEDYLLKKRPTEPMKSMSDRDRRFGHFKEVFAAADFRYAGKNILLFDDVFRSGTTLYHITEALYESGKVKNVYVLTLTKTGR